MNPKITLLTIAVLILLDPTYVTAYISVNYEIVLIYIVSALTLLYCIVSLLTIVVLILLDPTYVTAYISVNYEIVLIYIVSALTLLYCIVSVIMYFLLAKRGDETPLTNCSLTEVIFSTAGIMGWLIIIGIGGTISQRTIIETGERFGWIGRKVTQEIK
ncbi:hypothetical protein DICVIV_08860 [Dictyocaulus viviparus]|uniref:MARVEL domain-containing protein n=1 Tax=Dictyocaulus viviparus TaxID=29172 RepID=A0A0D8XKF6_DICVI|nr:hypothetical protein DICVIV_08860 [Dictyocaulus viviparus]